MGRKSRTSRTHTRLQVTERWHLIPKSAASPVSAESQCGDHHRRANGFYQNSYGLGARLQFPAGPMDTKYIEPRSALHMITGVEVMPISGLTCPQLRLSLGVSFEPSTLTCQS